MTPASCCRTRLGMRAHPENSELPGPHDPCTRCDWGKGWPAKVAVHSIVWASGREGERQGRPLMMILDTELAAAWLGKEIDTLHDCPTSPLAVTCRGCQIILARRTGKAVKLHGEDS